MTLHLHLRLPPPLVLGLGIAAGACHPHHASDPPGLPPPGDVRRDTAPAEPPDTPASPDDSARAALAALEDEIARLELRVLERDARIEELQARLDEARRDVVRTLARLQTLATRAEAASAIAEAEIAAAPVSDDQVRELLQMSALEFSRQNYGGALYLANQAKGLAAAARGGGRGGGSGRAGEVVFAVALRLEATSSGNVREGPGMEYAVAFTVARGTSLVGLSYVGDWVRVEADDGGTGWIHVTLVNRRGGPG